jgi:adenine deaminase
MDSSEWNLDSTPNYVRLARTWNWNLRTNPFGQKFLHAVSKRRLQVGFSFQKNLVKRLSEKKVLLLAGTDAPTIPGLLPSQSLHRELQKLVEAGLSNFEALQTATVNPAIFLNLSNRFGTIEVNKQGSLILLNNNPMLSINNSLSIVYVIQNGIVVFDNTDAASANRVDK